MPLHDAAESTDVTRGTATDARAATTGLNQETLTSICSVLQRYPAVRRAILFGSRAKGTARPESDIDLALEGEISAEMAARIAFDLDDLPLPYRFDVQALCTLEHVELRGHIERVGLELYRST